MFTINDDLSIYVTRGDAVAFSVTSEENGVNYVFQPGDVVRIKVFGKKDAETVVLQKDFPVVSASEKVDIFLTEQDTKIGEVISKPKDYWYEVELNPFTNPQTIIGYDDDGAKVFKLFPEGRDLTEFEPDIQPEDIPIVDRELDLTSLRPVENQAIARAITKLEAIAKDNAESIATDKARLDNLIAHKPSTLSQTLEYLDYITENTKSKVGGSIESDGVFSTITVNWREANQLYGGTEMGYFIIPAECRPVDTGLIHTEDGLEYSIVYDNAENRYYLNIKAQDGVTSAPSGAGNVTMSYMLGDYELMDIRVGANGKVYPTAGEAIRSQLASMSVTPQMFGAKGDGKTDDTAAIRDAINACSAFGTLRFLNKTYCVSEPVVLDKKINIDGCGAVLKATSEMECVLHLTNQGPLTPCVISHLNVDANKLAMDGVKIGGDNHTTQITFRDCVAQNAVRHGFCVLPVAYIINFVSCLAKDNGADGLNCVAPDSGNQINAITVEKCSFQRNGTSGLHINGVSFSVSECDSEFNKYGITVGGVDYVSYGVFITNCHLEYNSIASVYVDTQSSATVSVVRCYLVQTNYDETVGATAFIKCSKAAVDVSLVVDENTFQGDAALEYVDGGDKLGAQSRIVVNNIERVVNVKNAKIETTDTSERYLPLPMALSSGAGLSDCNTSVNLIGASKKSVKMVVPYDLVNALPRLIGVNVATDGTTAKLRCLAKKYFADGKTVVQQTYYDTMITESGAYSFNLLNNWGYKRVPNNAFVEVEFQLVDGGDATTFVLSNPYITAYV